MIHTCRQSPKFKLFVRKLRPLAQNPIVDVESIAVAILERLWHQTGVGARRGDIGRFDDELIAEECGWLGDSGALIRVLVESGFIDEHPQYRLVVHDWHEHAPRHIKQNANRWGGLITPTVTGETLGSNQPSHDGRLDSTPNLTKPNQTKEREKTPSKELPLEESDLSPDGDLRSKHFADARFHFSLDLWRQKLRSNNGREPDVVTLQAQLKVLEAFSTDEALAIVDFSTSRTNCNNLIVDGSHRKNSKAMNGRRKPKGVQLDLSK